MGILDRLLVGGAVALAGFGITKVVQASKEEARRRSTPPEFDSRLTQHDFTTMASNLAQKTPRVFGAVTDGLVVTIFVRSNSGLTTWSAELDFNDYGRATGRYWIRTENAQSPIPELIANSLRDQIVQRTA
ncbi:hypothetical protein M4D51_13000 [Microbacterium sp. p3-SID338]|uniref:hypothetical protein n=1 Tax=Microbacterium sp. p3-SID338 TaxID=2916214 RepID=UPI0021A90D26|nr:hypothetical protein [Microbacterium sp. p3-SID338]MCT1396642.1 hypothetical protein [Microbacterium sp. p3-SID338]